MKTRTSRRASIRTKRLFSRKRLLIAVTTCLLAIGIYTLVKNDNVADKKNPSDVTTVNTQPATEQEKAEAEQNKDRIASTNQSTNTGQKKTVKPVITDISNNTVRAYVSGVFEDGGTCTATFTKGGKTLTKTSSGFENVSYTQCGPINYEDGFLSPGKWSVTVKYNSATAEGVSDERSIDAQ